MKSTRLGLGSWATSAACVALAATCTVLAHPDDPKLRDRVPRYEGPGYRADHAADAAPLGFPSLGVQLLAWLPIGEFDGSGSANDCWGYTSPSGREYAIIGLGNGTGFAEITNPGDPVVIGVIPGQSSTWRDIKVYEHHAYSVTEGGDGIQVIDMTQIDSGTVTLVNIVDDFGTGSTHNVALDPVSGFLYRSGGGSNGIRIYDLADPPNPEFVGFWETRYVHDLHPVTYTEGPYAGREIAFCCAGFNGGWGQTGLTVLDVTNKSSIVELDHLEYPNGQYSHQGWLSEDRQYFYLDDEADEGGGATTITHVIDVSDIENPQSVTTFTNGSTAIGHNLYVRDGLIYEANYRSGLRVFDATGDPTSPVEIAYYDTWPEDDNPNFNGLWSVYPFFESGVVIGSDIEKGLFVWHVDEPVIEFQFPTALPDLIDPSGDTVEVSIVELEPGGLVPGSAMMHYSIGEEFTAVPLVSVGGDVYEAAFPAIPCGTEVSYYFSAETSSGFTMTSPPNAPSTTYSTTSAIDVVVAFEDDMETDPGYTVEHIDLQDGAWERGVPVGGGDRGDPPTDFDGSGAAWVTANEDGDSDVDGGPTRLISPILDLSGLEEPFISYARWFTNDDQDGDRLDVDISSNGGTSWTLVESVSHQIGWQVHTFRVADVVPPTGTMKIRFSATDNPNDSVTEAGIDALRVISYICDSGVPGDVDGDGDVDFSDLLEVLSNWGACPPPPAECPADLDGSGAVDFTDLLTVLSNWS